jgi:hypothetical protein
LFLGGNEASVWALGIFIRLMAEACGKQWPLELKIVETASEEWEYVKGIVDG